jgi:hypothetical protein
MLEENGDLISVDVEAQKYTYPTCADRAAAADS